MRRRACPRACLLPVVWTLMQASGAVAQTVELRGVVVDEGGRPMPQARLRVVSHGTLSLTSDAEFRMALDDRTTSVVIQVIEPADQALVYPLDGRVAVPRGTEHQTIILGRSRENVIVDALSDQIARVELAVHQRSTAADITRLRDEMLGAFEPILKKLEIDEERLRQRLEDRSKQVSIATDIKEMLNPYVLTLEDLRDYLVHLTPHLASDPAAVAGLQRVMEAYSEAFAALDARQDSFQAQIASAWTGSAGEGLRRDWEDVRVQAVIRIHRGNVLPLNPALIVLQRMHTASRPSQQEVDEAFAAIRVSVSELTRELPVLKEKRRQLYASLDFS